MSEFRPFVRREGRIDQPALQLEGRYTTWTLKWSVTDIGSALVFFAVKPVINLYSNTVYFEQNNNNGWTLLSLTDGALIDSAVGTVGPRTYKTGNASFDIGMLLSRQNSALGQYYLEAYEDASGYLHFLVKTGATELDDIDSTIERAHFELVCMNTTGRYIIVWGRDDTGIGPKIVCFEGS